jgi:hypothetical protein
MAITVKHTKVSTIPDGDDSSLIRPSDWNADHQLVGTVPPANGGTGASTLTGYVKGNGTNTMTASSTIPNTDVTGLGTASTKDAGVANGVATLDGSGTVPISQLPAAVIGALSYQGTWNASTNTPTLTSSVGTKGYYYVVNVAGSTNLNGITDWQVGDWAVYNGTAWQKIDNTDAVTSVNGKTGTVVLTYSDVGAFPATSTTGSGNVVLATGATLSNPTISNYETWTSASAPSYAEGLQWYDSTSHSLAYYNDSANAVVHIGQDIQVKVINNTGSTIANGSPVYITSTSSGQTYPNVALAKADVAATSAVIGLTNGAIANGAIGYVTSQGGIDNVNTGTFTVGQVLYLSPYSAGQLMNTIPPTGITVQVGVVSYVNSSTGKIYVKQTTPLAVPASIITGTLGVANGGTGVQTITGYIKGSGTSAFTGSSTIPTTDLSGTITNAQLANSSITINGNSTSLGGSVSVGTVTSVAATAGTGISVSGSPITGSGTLTITNTAPDQTVALTSGTGISVTGTYPNFTVTNTAPSSGGTVTSVSATAPVVSSGGNTPTISMAAANTTTNGYLTSTDWNTFNNKQPSGSYLTAVTADAPLSGSGTSGSHLVIATANTSTTGALSSTDWNTFNNKQATLVSGTNIKTVNGTSLLGSGDVPVGVLTVTGTAPVVSSGGANPAISMAAANGTTNGYLTSTDWTTFNNKGSGTVTSVAASVPSFLSVSGSPVTTSGTLAISYSGTALPVANGGTGLTSVTAGYVPYGNGTGALSTSSGLYYSGSLLGVGTATPASVAGNAVVIYDSASPRLRLTSSTTGQATTDGAEVSLLATTNQLVIENRENASTLFYNNGTNTASLSTTGALTTAGPISASNGSTGGFYSTTFATNTSNNIWAFGNATNYGLKYFQGTAGTSSIDTIALPFGQTTSSASYFQFICNGSNIGGLVMPSQPRFLAGIAATSDATFNSGSYLPFNSTIYNDSGSYSTSNYYFTAPIAGKYLFFFNIFFTPSGGSTYYMQVGPTLNGSFINTPSGDAQGCLAFNPTVAVGEFTGTMVISMAAGDKVGIQPRTSSIRVYQGHCSFGGYLIG